MCAARMMDDGHNGTDSSIAPTPHVPWAAFRVFTTGAALLPYPFMTIYLQFERIRCAVSCSLIAHGYWQSVHFISLSGRCRRISPRERCVSHIVGTPRVVATI